MDLMEFQAKLFAKGREQGFGEMEIYFQADRDTTVRVFKGEIDNYSIAEQAGLSFRAQIDGKMGYSYTEKLDEESIELLLQEAKENAAIIESQNEEELFAGSASYKKLNTFSEALANVSAEALIEAAKTMEQAALAADPRIQMVNSCSLSASNSELTIINTKGLNVHTKSTIAAGFVSAVAKANDQGEVTTGVEVRFTLTDLSALPVQEIAKRAAQEAVSKLGAQTIASGAYPVIFRNDMAGTLLRAFSSIFSGEAAEKGLSLLQGRIGEQVAGANITIVDDPHRADGPGSTPFDAEGVATAPHPILKAGRLETFLHNRKTAKKAGVETTGNAVKGSYRGSVSVAPHNLIFEPGERSFDELLAGTERGVLIVELQGIHAGANPVSGDFSLSAIGHLIENGQVVRPVNQITVAGNILEVLNNVEEIGNDLRFTGFGNGACGAPSFKVKSLAISGK